MDAIVQLAAFVDVHASVVLCPRVIVVGEAVKVSTESTGAAVTVKLRTTVALFPPGPVQNKLYEYDPAVHGAVPVVDPSAAYPGVDSIVQLVAFVEVQARFIVDPAGTEIPEVSPLSVNESTVGWTAEASVVAETLAGEL